MSRPHPTKLISAGRQLARMSAHAYTRWLLMNLADALEAAETKLRDSEWDREWERKQKGRAA